MATKFSGPRSTSYYPARIRWLIGLLCSVIAVLAAVVIIVFSEGKHNEETLNPTPIANASQLSTVDILVARQRIEAGTLIEPYMLDQKAVSSEKLPGGAFLARDKVAAIGFYTKLPISTGFPIENTNLTTEAPENLELPTGYRAVAITLGDDARVDQFVKPGRIVDVLWHSGDAIDTLVRYARVLSVSGSLNPKEGTPQRGVAVTFTLMVTEEDGKRIELAKHHGSLSLLLDPLTETYPKGKEPSHKITVKGLNGPEPIKEQHFPGSFESVDPVTGKVTKRYLTDDGKWIEKKPSAQNSQEDVPPTVE